jgi:hypothetical protein
MPSRDDHTTRGQQSFLRNDWRTHKWERYASDGSRRGEQRGWRNIRKDNPHVLHGCKQAMKAYQRWQKTDKRDLRESERTKRLEV